MELKKFSLWLKPLTLPHREEISMLAIPGKDIASYTGKTKTKCYQKISY